MDHWVFFCYFQCFYVPRPWHISGIYWISKLFKRVATIMELFLADLNCHRTCCNNVLWTLNTRFYKNLYLVLTPKRHYELAFFFLLGLQPRNWLEFSFILKKCEQCVCMYARLCIHAQLGVIFRFSFQSFKKW